MKTTMFSVMLPGMNPKADPYWRKALLAAHILLRARTGGKLPSRYRLLARRLADDPGVTDRLIDRVVACQIARRKNHVPA